MKIIPTLCNVVVSYSNRKPKVVEDKKWDRLKARGQKMHFPLWEVCGTLGVMKLAQILHLKQVNTGIGNKMCKPKKRIKKIDIDEKFADFYSISPILLW